MFKITKSIIILANNDNTISIIVVYTNHFKEVQKMTFFRWLGGFILLFWIIGLIFKIGGSFINFLLIIAALIFVVDLLFGKKKSL